MLRQQVITASELSAAGIGKNSAARSSQVTRVASGLYVVGSDPPWNAYLAAGLKIGGPGSAAFGTSAAALFGFAEYELPVRVLVPRGVNLEHRSWVRFFRSDLSSRRVLYELDPPRVAFEDTVLDLIRDSDEQTTIAILTQALQERRTTVRRIRFALMGRARQRHRRLVQALLDDAAGIESLLEHEHLVKVERAHALPPMTRQFVVPETAHRSDGAYEERRMLIELDGVQYHDPVADRALDNLHASFGYTTLRLTWTDCRIKPCETARLLGGGRPCRHCRDH